ncbi:hypothetical protein [Pseudomonas sp. M30-35]|uniref:hypothetical protein n=1 Tax=Pseudomonas sp. M30-35 TaxID=1981174 RepID=UPI000B3C99C0|nr:hypothetical protein [Pseudomonas sp. M30-35]ARU87850.1 hypothetical protein B9K09_07665 [Pseudomonas sp. M30-35]
MDMLDSTVAYTLSTILILSLLGILGLMLLGNVSDRKENEILWLYRGAGVEVAFVLLPFMFYAIGSLLNGSYHKFIASPELPMAGMILAALSIISLMKGLAASRTDLAIEKFIVFAFISIMLLLGIGAYVAWLAFAENVSPWFGALNGFIILCMVIFSFVVHAVMAELVRKSQVDELPRATKESTSE